MDNLCGDVIYKYSREQAISDGVMIDVSDMAEEAGFKIPVAITVGVWEKVIDIRKGLEGIQDVQGRLWDILYVGAVRARDIITNTFNYTIIMPHGRKRNLELKVVLGAGDNGEPVVTIMLPEED